MDRRLLGNILIFTLCILLGTGFLLYFIPFEKRIASLHTFFALLFIVAMVFHILNNRLPLKNYLTGKRLQKFKKLQSPFIFLLIVLTTVAIYFENPTFNALYNWGNTFRNTQLGKTEKTFDYQIISMDKTIGNQKISIELKKGTAFQYPLFAVWIEDENGNYIETLYVSRVIASSTFDFGKKVNDTWSSATLRRPEALPYWSHKRGIKAADGLYVPLNATDLDAVSGATPTENFIISSQSKRAKNSNYNVYIELNQSYDWNDFYTKDKFPNDKIYSGSGQVGQPSLIYRAKIDFDNKNTTTHKIMQLMGHGHYSGKDGNLYSDISNITSAKNIAERIIVSIERSFNVK